MKEGLGPMLEDLHARGFLVQDLLGVARGLKPMCRAGLTRADEESVARLRRFGEAAGLAVEVYRSDYEAASGPMIMAAADPARLKDFKGCVESKHAAKTAPETWAATKRMGELLGYPPCCVDAFVASEKKASAGRPSFFARGLSPRARRTPVPYALNFLYNFHSRSSGPDGELARMLGAGYRLMEAYLIPWIPCAWDCAPSAAYARKIVAAMEDALPEMARGLKELLSLPVLFVDDWRFVPLTGARWKDGTLLYEKPFDAKTLTSEETLELLRRGDSLRPDADGAAVFKGGKKIGAVPDAVLIRFSVDRRAEGG
jgi:hypothetical protein